MKNSCMELTIEEVFRGLSDEEIMKVKSLLPVEKASDRLLGELISGLSPADQWIIDNYLEKAIRLQRIRLYLKKSLVISILIVAAVLILILVKLLIQI